MRGPVGGKLARVHWISAGIPDDVGRGSCGVPGGNRAPYGLIREGHPSTLRIDEEKAAVVQRAYELAAAGSTDWEVAAQTGLAKTHVEEILTNPIYMGRLRTGEPAGVAPIVEAALFSRVQTARERRRTRTPGRIVKRAYALRLRCAGCRRFLYGDVGRYRHPAPTCAAFQAARPHMPRTRGHRHDTRIKGHSYPQAWYEDAVGAILDRIGRVDDATISEVVRLHDAYGPRADELALARIKRAREDAARRLAETRDLAAWQATMTRLDAEERVAREHMEIRRLTPPDAARDRRLTPARSPASGLTRGPVASKRSWGRSSPGSTFSGSSASSTSSRRMRWTSDWTPPCRP